jgi:hypothetical protein
VFRRWQGVYSRIIGLLFTALCVSVAAQDSNKSSGESSDVYVTVRTSPAGHVTFDVSAFADREQNLDQFFDAAIRELRCDWREFSRSDYGFRGICRKWLNDENDSRTPVLRLAGFVRALYDIASQTSLPASQIVVGLDLANSGAITAPEGWAMPEGDTSGTFLRFESHGPAQLPPDIPIPLRASPSLLIPILMVLLGPAFIARMIRRRASEASAGQKIN